MARRSDFARRQPINGARLWVSAVVAVVCLAFFVIQPARADTWSQLHQETAQTEYNLNYLTNLARELANNPELAHDAALKSWLRQQITAQLRQLQSLTKAIYQECEAMKHPTGSFFGPGNSGALMKFILEVRHRNQAIAMMAKGILGVHGGVESTALSQATGEGGQAAMQIPADTAEVLAKGTEIAKLFGKVGAALELVDAGAQLYTVYRDVQVGTEAIDWRHAADAKLTHCKKPPNYKDQQSLGTGPLSPFPPGAPPIKPRRPTPKPEQKKPPKKPINNLREFLILSLTHHGE